MVPGGEIKMGPGRYERFTRCPWGTVLTRDVTAWLRAHYTAKEYPAAVPASAWRDPQMLEAFATIDSEQSRCLAEAAKPKER